MRLRPVDGTAEPVVVGIQGDLGVFLGGVPAIEPLPPNESLACAADETWPI